MGKNHASQYANFGSLPYIVYYKEVYNVDRKRQMYSTITFSADIIMIGDAYLSNQW